MPTRRARRIIAACAALLIGIGGMLAATAPAAAAPLTLVVNSNGDAGVGTLRQAILDANANIDASPDTIQFDFAGPATINLLSLLPAITDPLLIDGPGSAQLTILSSTDGAVLAASSAVSLEVRGLTLTSGAASSVGLEADTTDVVLSDVVASGHNGPGIDVAGGALSATQVHANGNEECGICFEGWTPAHSIYLEVVWANGTVATGLGDGTGIYADLTGGTATLIGATVAGNDWCGIDLLVGGGILSAQNVVATGNDCGVGILLTSGAAGTIADSSATGNDSIGWAIGAYGGQVTVQNTVGSTNGAGGFALEAVDGSVELTSAVAEFNGPDPCGCGGSGMSLAAFDSEVKITGSMVRGNTSEVGGGIDLVEVTDSTVTISGSTITGNHALAFGGAGGYGGGIAVNEDGSGYVGSDTSLTIADTEISGNTADEEGGGVYLSGIGFDFGGSGPAGSVTFVRSTIAGNTAGYGGGVLIDEFTYETNLNALILFEASTISGNTATDEGGGLYVYKSDDADPGLGIVELLNTTVSGNTAITGAGLAVDSEADPGNFTTRLRHSTIAANTASAGTGGVLTYGSDQQLLLDHALIGGNGADLDTTDPITGFGARYSLVQTTPLALPAGQGNLQGIDPALGPLADNGGPTLTHAVLESSPVFNAGDPAFVAPPSLDQRGQPRVIQVIDIGAFERYFAHPAAGTQPHGGAAVGALLMLLGIPLLILARRSRPILR